MKLRFAIWRSHKACSEGEKRRSANIRIASFVEYLYLIRRCGQMFKRRIGRVKNECVSHQGRFVSACSLSCFFPQQDAEFRSNSGWRELISFLHFKKYFSIDRHIFVCSGMAPLRIFEHLRADRDLRCRLHRDPVFPQRIYRERDTILQRFSNEIVITHLQNDKVVERNLGT